MVVKARTIVLWDAEGVEEIPIRGEMIRLGQLLVFAGLVESGGMAKAVIAQGLVRVNGEVDERRGRQCHKGDVVDVDGQVQVKIT